MKFGQRSADAPDTSTGNYLRNFKKGENLVRWLEEIDDWTVFWEHYKNKKGFPCTGNQDTCPGCTHPDEDVAKASKKYATYARFVKADKVFPVRIPVTLRDRMVVRSERNNGSVLTRDYIVIKTGSGFDTEYDVDQDEKYEVETADLIGKSPCTVQEALADHYVEVWGELPDEPSKDAGTKSNKADDVPPTEPAAQKDKGEQVEEVTEADIRAMDLDELRALCKRAGLRFVSDDTAEDLVEKLLREFGA